jgi:hypothetical protein
MEAGGKVLWVERRGHGAALVAAGDDGVAHDLAAFPTQPSTADAAGAIAVVDLEQAVAIDVATGAQTPLACKGLRALWGSVLGCGRTLTDLADGTTAQLDRDVIAAGGRLALLGRDEKGRFELIDWRSRTPVRTLPDLESVSIGEDGTVVYSAASNLYLLAPGGRPKEIRLSPTPEYVYGADVQVRVAGGRLAVRRGKFLTLAGVDGTRAITVEASDLIYAWSFDGARLAWWTRPCARGYVVAWDVAEAPPEGPRTDCALPAITKARMKGSTLELTLRCPAEPADGCAGDAFTRKVGWPYRIAAGHTGHARLRLRGKRPRHVSIELINSAGRQVTRSVRPSM